MKLQLATPWLLMFYLAPAWAESPLSPDNAKISFVLADDLQVELVACEPLIASPCAIAFDAKGRMFVAENRGYPRMETPPQGVVAMLTDADGDGRMDQRTVFADRLTYPNGVLPWKDGLIVTCAPDVLFLRDTNGDGKADEKRVLLTGFATTGSTQLRVNAPQIGPDGWIYLAAGLSGGNLTCPEHPERPALKMTSDVRFHPDTLEVQPVDGKSQFGQSFDAYGRRFICMNRLPVQHVVLESKWLARNPQLAFSETVQDCNERDVKTVMKSGGDGVRLFPISSNITTADSHQGSFSAACGITIWRSGALPARYDGGALSCDPTANVIHCDKLEPTGASFRAVPLLKNQEMLASRDDWFRPVFLTRGPDGALYVADMYRKVIEHPDYLPEEVRKHTDFESGRNQGRIWRISAKTPMPTRALPPFIDEFTSIQPAAKDVALAAQLAHDESARVRFLLALTLGDSTADFVLPVLAEIAARDAADKWTRAAVLSGIAGREAKFLQALWPLLKAGTDGELELLVNLGGCFPSAAALQETLNNLKARPSASMASVWVGCQERQASKPDVALLEFACQQTTTPAVPLGQRIIYARLLASGTYETAAPSLLLAWKAQPEETLATVLVRSLTQLDGNRALALLVADQAWSRYSPVLRETLLNAVFARGQFFGLLEALETKGIPTNVLTLQRRDLLTKHKDPAISERAGKIFSPQLGTRTEALQRAKNALSLKPVPTHGREVFKQLCTTCHRLEREGVNVGPDLFDIRNQPKETILFHLVMPEAEVAPAFAPYVCETKSGRSIAGILSSETTTSITIRQPAGLQETVLRTELKSLHSLPGTLMPTGLDAAMTPQDIADLVAFLKGEG